MIKHSYKMTEEIYLFIIFENDLNIELTNNLNYLSDNPDLSKNGL